MKRNIILLIVTALLGACTGPRDESTTKNYHLDGNGISKEALSNYLDRSITMVYLMIPHRPEGNRGYSYHADDMRMVKALQPKFIGRAFYRWGGESRLNDSLYWKEARNIADEIHRYDSEIILQGCLFEIITEESNEVPVPEWVFREFGLPVERRTFSYEKMLNAEGRLVNHWRRGSSVPDISRQETQMWFYYLARSYMDVGCEAFHLGQIELIGMNDPRRDAWADIIRRIRSYAHQHARRHWVLLDAHTPKGGMVKDGISLIDFNSFPLRIKERPVKPYQAELAVGHLDALYQKSQGCISPSGWRCEHLPYLVEFDNFGQNGHPNVADLDSHFVWGWDEISWLAQQPEDQRNAWLEYAWRWIKQHDPDGHLEMPGCRMITCPNQTEGYYRANTRSETCPTGYSQEETIKKIWTDN